MVTAGINPVGQRNFFFPLALAYLVLPNLIFLATWLRPGLGVPASVLITAVAGWLFWQRGATVPRPKLSRQTFGFVLALAFLWTLIGGVAGVFPQSSDYFKHNLLFHDLVHSAWPVNYTSPGGEKNYLCYGLGYYLVPSLGGRLLGEAVVPWLAFAWTLAGTALFFYWIATFDRKPRSTLVIFLLFAVTGILWLFFKKHGLPGLINPDGLESRLTQLGLLFSYNDSFTRFQYQPQHALIGWLGTALLYDVLWVEKNPAGALFVWAAGLLWSPLSCLGLLLVPLAALNRVRWQNYFEPVNLLGGGLLLAVMGIYFQGHVPLAERGPIWNFSTGNNWLVIYPLFLALELSSILFLFLADRKYKIFPELRPLFLSSAGLLMLLPLYKIGFNSDLRLQASAPALLFIALAASRCWHSGAFSLKRPLGALLTGSVLLGAVYPLARPWQNLLFNTNDCSYANIVQTTGYRNLSELHDRDFDAGALYLGRPNSAAARWLLR